MSDWPPVPTPVSMGEIKRPSALQAHGAPYVVRSRGAHKGTPQSAERLHYSPTSPRKEQERGQHVLDAATSATASGAATTPNADPRLRHATRVDTLGSASSSTAKRSATPLAVYAPRDSRAHGREPEALPAARSAAHRPVNPLSDAHVRERTANHALTAQTGSDPEAPLRAAQSAAHRPVNPLSAAHVRERTANHSMTARAGNDPEAPQAARARTRGSGSGRKEKKKKHSPVVCTNNKLDPRLAASAGTQELGTRSQCIRRGFGSGLHSKPEDVEDFLRKHSVPYSKIIEQKLWYKDSTDQMPAGYQVATLPQAFQRGFGAGQAKLARQLLQERRAKRRGARA